MFDLIKVFVAYHRLTVNYIKTKTELAKKINKSKSLSDSGLLTWCFGE